MGTDPENGEGFVEGFDESAELTDDDLLTIQDEEGNDVLCAIITVFVHEEAQYVVMQPVEQLEADEIDTYLFRYEVNDDGLPVLMAIEDDAVFDAVCEAFSGM